MHGQYVPTEENPACLQTTCASMELQWSSHTVPQVPLTQTSTRPSRRLEPPTSLISPCVEQAIEQDIDITHF